MTAAEESRDLLVNVFAWTANVSTSVVTIFVIKALMSVYRFKYATTVSGLHFVCCAWAVWGLERAGIAEQADMPLRSSLLFACVGALSIGTANLSLLLNSVGFYQIAKLLMSPFVAAVEMLWLKKRFPPAVLACIVVVLAGVGIVTVSDVSVQLPGLVMAGLFIVSGGLQQILCGHMQATLKIQSHQLMSNTSFLQGMILMIVGPFVDKLASSKWIMEWEASVPGIEMLGLSCLLAVAVNASQYLVLGRFSATSFQVLGHAKTLLVLIGGWLLFDEEMNPRKVLGMSLAFVGMVGYGVFSLRAANAAKADAAKAAAVTAAATKQQEALARGSGTKAATPAQAVDGEKVALLAMIDRRSTGGGAQKLQDEEAPAAGAPLDLGRPAGRSGGGTAATSSPPGLTHPQPR
ncbi:hypothetical protein CHLRE_02g144300v5 [Chlamydomonas reinhardtii]|uniref:Sugar phosphate transporter domain-containing protein n=1 Tax=Chlamydomonas reinhardtii TaxID=3055 RepID=A0A2K3E3V2_CHLRE|nr:uncharacterized protein CHLRE_02g144300v5 [Chlamydomonas reinhardtii]PNW87474.1 hypothetical protein CHLRE_02g144300v5 [Chlamydomonas reinhardtii]